MRKIITIAIILLLSLGGWAQEKQQTSTDALCNELKTEYQNYINRVDVERNMFFVFVSVLLAAIGIGAPIYINNLSKTQGKKILDKISAQIASDPNALIEALREKSIELALKREFNLILIYHGNDENNKNHLLDMLHEFGFKNCIEKKDDEINDLRLSKNHILLLFDDKDEKIEMSSKWLIQTINEKIWSFKEICGYLYINNYGSKHNFDKNQINCFGASNSGSTIYNNLMSLLHYKRYLNNSNKKQQVS